MWRALHSLMLAIEYHASQRVQTIHSIFLWWKRQFEMISGFTLRTRRLSASAADPEAEYGVTSNQCEPFDVRQLPRVNWRLSISRRARAIQQRNAPSASPGCGGIIPLRCGIVETVLSINIIYGYPNNNLPSLITSLSAPYDFFMLGCLCCVYEGLEYI